MTDLSLNLELCLICCHFESPQNRYFCQIEISFAINQFQTMQSLCFWKKILRLKLILLFTKEFPFGMMVRVFTNGPGDLGSIPVESYQRLKKWCLLNTQHYKVGIKGKVEPSWETSSALPYTLVLKLSKREPSGHPRLRLQTLHTYWMTLLLLTAFKIDNQV